MKTLTFDFDNVPGLASIYAIPYTPSLRPLQQYIDNFQELMTADDTVQIPVYEGDNFVFSENQTLEEGGELWATSIAGIIPRLYRPSEQVIAELERGNWWLLFQDRNGTIILSGTEDVPLKFASAKSSGTSSEMNGYRFTFAAKNAQPSLIVGAS